MVAVGQDLGLHRDCSTWKIPTWEKGLRKRLAWALFMQDKWAALVCGRPSHISNLDWVVKPMTEGDFPENATDEDDREGSTEVEKGRHLFCQMVSLTEILSEILEALYSSNAEEQIKSATTEATQLVLFKAKPLQIKLKAWYANLPDSLSMNDVKVRKLSSTGYLHLAYISTEIALHRRILRTLATCTDTHLVEICRSAAAARSTSAMVFVKGLKPEHLQSFWYFASKYNFAIVGIFQSLLCGTALSKEEAAAYLSQLDEYRWTLRIYSKNAEFLEQIMATIDLSATDLRTIHLDGTAFTSIDHEPLNGKDNGPAEDTSDANNDITPLDLQPLEAGSTVSLVQTSDHFLQNQASSSMPELSQWNFSHPVYSPKSFSESQAHSFYPWEHGPEQETHLYHG